MEEVQEDGCGVRHSESCAQGHPGQIAHSRQHVYCVILCQQQGEESNNILYIERQDDFYHSMNKDGCNSHRNN
jgi:hypothetical protein